MTPETNNPPAENKNNISFLYDTHYNTVSPIGQFTLQSFTNMMCDTFVWYIHVCTFLPHNSRVHFSHGNRF